MNAIPPETKSQIPVAPMDWYSGFMAIIIAQPIKTYRSVSKYLNLPTLNILYNIPKMASIQITDKIAMPKNDPLRATKQKGV